MSILSNGTITKNKIICLLKINHKFISNKPVKNMNKFSLSTIKTIFKRGVRGSNCSVINKQRKRQFIGDI